MQVNGTFSVQKYTESTKLIPVAPDDTTKSNELQVVQEIENFLQHY